MNYLAGYSKEEGVESYSSEGPYSIGEINIRLSKLLGQTEPLPASVIVSAVEDPLYCHHLFTCRDNPVFLQMLIQNPPTAVPGTPIDSNEQPSFALSRQAIKSFWKWARSGFALVDVEQYERRLSACRSCPNYVDPVSNLLLYRIVGNSDGDPDQNKICNLCGCVIAKKARLASEFCPEAHPDKPELTRWGEPIG